MALSLELTVVVETRCLSTNKVISKYKNSTIVDIACGYSPRALNEQLKDMPYIGCNLPIVTDEIAPVIGGMCAERVPMSNYVTEIGSLADYSDEAKADYIKSLENVYIWIFTPDENFEETEENYESDSFGVTANVYGGEMKIALRGRLDSVTAPELLGVYEKTAAKEKAQKIVVDASELEYISSAGLRVLLLMIKQVGNGNLTVTGQNDTLQTIFDQTGFSDILNC